MCFLSCAAALGGAVAAVALTSLLVLMTMMMCRDTVDVDGLFYLHVSPTQALRPVFAMFPGSHAHPSLPPFTLSRCPFLDEYVWQRRAVCGCSKATGACS